MAKSEQHSLSERSEQAIEAYQDTQELMVKLAEKYNVTTGEQFSAKVWEPNKQRIRKASEMVKKTHKKLILTIATHHYARVDAKWRSTLSLSDLLDAGWHALSRAETEYDRRRGYRFATLATWWIRNEVLQEIERRIEAAESGAELYDLHGDKNTNGEGGDWPHKSPFDKDMKIAAEEARVRKLCMIEDMKKHTSELARLLSTGMEMSEEEAGQEFEKLLTALQKTTTHQ